MSAPCEGVGECPEPSLKLTPDLIYEATLDDQLFEELPTIVAEAMGARSCVLHWRDERGAAEVFTHSGYFGDGHMADYAETFAGHDLWTDAGMAQGFVNRAWRTTDLVPASAYERSIFYNEWIRAMGDDTYYCCGSVMRTAHGDGIIGLHRGKGQADFSQDVLQQLNGHVGHLRRMFAIRGRISTLADRNNLLHAIFASGRQAALMVNADCRVTMANDAGESILRSGRFLRLRAGALGPAAEPDRSAFARAVAIAAGPAKRHASTFLLRSGDGAVVIASITPLPGSGKVPAVLITADTPSALAPPDVIARHLQRGFALSPAEADIAVRLGDGATVGEIGEQRRATTETVRSQVKSVIAKMGVRRQGDVVRIVNLLKRGHAAGGEPDSDEHR